tara:strand:- start:2084 stop:2584 length:501 start_codon:yes stop_codon:yes gene_type:complete
MRTLATKLFVSITIFLTVITLTFGQLRADERYLDKGNGSILDSQTGLLWQKGDSHHDLSKPVSWYDALDYANRMNGKKYAGYSDWRLPTLKELHGIWDPAKTNSTKDQERIGLPAIFSKEGSYYLWTSDERGLDMAWYFGLGQQEDYFNLKEANDLGQGVKLVRRK